MYVFLNLDEDNRVTGYGSTEPFEGAPYARVEEDDPFLDNPTVYKFIDGELVLDEDYQDDAVAEWDEMINRPTPEQEIKNLKDKSEQLTFDTEAIRNITAVIVGDDSDTERMNVVAHQVHRALQLFAQTLDEDTALEIADLYPVWEPNKSYKANEILRYGTNDDGESQLYKVMQAHNSQADWLPPNLAALYKKIGFEEDGTAIWVQPQGAHDAYAVGDIVSHNGQTWRSTIAGNVWEPGVYGWVVQP